ncbi:MAG: hypothetical protein MK004_21460 [Planctomycetales bacterium]|nr:hypothetical protein [Planctomycetales bacterium]
MMAIEFDCPYCTAAIRVNDTAAGKRGACPKCGTSLIVPRPAEIVPEVVESPAGSAHPEPDVIPDVVPDMVPEFQSRPQASVSSRVRRRRHRRGGLVFPLACGGLLLLAITVAWFLNDPTRFQGSLVGELTASDAGTEVLVPRSIDPDLAERHAELYAELIESLKEGTGRVRSNVMVVVFDESEGKLAVGIEPSQEYRLVRVALGQSEALGRFVESQSSRLDGLRRDDLAEELGKLVFAWHAARTADEPFDGWTSFRESVGLAALVGGVGHHATAQTGRQNLPCLYEAGGALFFLVPATLDEFRLIGRRRADGSMPFPADFRVRIGRGR